ncbi:hypothetical protein ONS95_000338 [Cadophora gregata]|nr:uncharacterized protein ONS95_000338 [Cadophora gregata]KAK0128366.1 hypothetical protein ONS95_000338 [Cadophora gregata]
MWLRDLLPKTKPFDGSRILTFGYNALLKFSDDLSGIQEWSIDLLSGISSLRTTEEEISRPIIFVCHSLGGLVVRQAMIRLDGSPHLFNGIKSNLCGAVFLSTPHSGSGDADWNRYLDSLIEITGDVHADATVNSLRSFNCLSTRANEEFGNLKINPPYESFCESRETKSAEASRQIVTIASATLNGKEAMPIPDVDHYTICKYDSKFREGYQRIVASLLRIKGLLKNPNMATLPLLQRTPNGVPPVDARHYPLAPGKRWYEGRGLYPERRPRVLEGRQMELQLLNDFLAICQRNDSSVIAVTGIGGIGKTEILLEFARQQINKMNIFFIYAKDEDSLRDAYHYVARQLGHLMIVHDQTSQSTALDIWNNLSQDEKIERFKQWLRRPENAETLFMLDDLDGLRSYELVWTALPHEAKIILFSSRNPVLCEQLNWQSHHLRLRSMDHDDVVQIMEGMLQRMSGVASRTLPSRERLQEIASALDGYPMASMMAIRYITRVLAQETPDEPEVQFLQIMQGPDFVSRKHFLEYKSGNGPSIMDTFLTSKQRLRDPYGISWKIMQFSAFLETSDPSLDFRRFFYAISRECILQTSEFPDHDVLTANTVLISEGFAEIEAVSFGEPAMGSIPARFHPIWLECTLQCMGEANRIRYMRQVLMICHMMALNSDSTMQPEAIQRHINRSRDICNAFSLILNRLGLPPVVLVWLRALGRGR